jgi:hypothetical protein
MKEQNNKPKNWISFRVKPEEYESIYRHYKNSTCQKLSEYARKVLLKKPVTIRYRNVSADQFLHEMLGLKRELNAIGHNYNQVVKKLHTLNHDSEISHWLFEHEKIRQLFMQQKEIILSKLDQIYHQWLSK